MAAAVCLTHSHDDDRTTGDRVPRRLPVGCRDRQLPDRGRRQRGRASTERLGHVLAHRGQGGQRRDGRHRLRPLPSGRRGRRDDGRPRLADVSLLGVVVAGGARRPWHGQRGRHRLLPAARRSPAGPRHHAVPDALPLGSPPGARGARRLPEPGHRQLVRRLRRADGTRTRRPGADVVDVQRAVVLRLPRPRVGPSRAGTHRPGRGRHRRPSRVARPRPRRRARCAPSATDSSSGS